jgi:protein-S-isoprenylcysteine O-methyltransferase
MIPALWLAAAYGVSEFFVARVLRSRAPDSANTDKGSLRRLMLVIYCSAFAAIYASNAWPQLNFGNEYLYWIGLATFVSGVAVRWAAIAWLGKFFTVNVAIADDHRVIDTGPYRYIRHPAYLGVLLAFLGLGLCIGNAATLFFFFVPPTAVFLHRIRIEEDALSNGLSHAYVQYMQRTKRLIPGVY